MKQYKVFYSKTVMAENEEDALRAIPQTVYGELKAIEICPACGKEEHGTCSMD